MSNKTNQMREQEIIDSLSPTEIIRKLEKEVLDLNVTAKNVEGDLIEYTKRCDDMKAMLAANRNMVRGLDIALKLLKKNNGGSND